VPEARLDCIKKILNMVPTIHLRLLIYLVTFLRKVSEHASENKMNNANLAMVFAPNLLRSQDDSVNACIADTPHASKMMETMLDQYDYLFKVGVLSAGFVWWPLVGLGSY
jgi:hypothetical protein